MIKAKALSVLSAASLILAAFLGCSSYALHAENSRLKSELQSLGMLHQTLKAEYAGLRSAYDELFDDYSLLNQSYHGLSLEYVSLNQTFYALMHNYTELSLGHQKLLSSYVELTVTYGALNQTYHELLQNYTKLEREAAGYTALLSEYEGLIQIYQSLLANYTELKEKYDAFYAALYKPLLSGDKVVPTTEELKRWLTEDKTDEIEYKEPDFVCGDYAVMLHMHAKAKGWDMGVVAILGKLGLKPFTHVFNAIICREGLVYIEPQNDEVFNGPIREEYYHPGFGWVHVEKLIVVVLYDGA
ncbi:MAG: hypothetical protein RMJ15_06555 [Nitrososphaerota archaeon]|nr:hypothetical protein [Candidatus Bathyarchaeota archaeon]MDW8023379.1 hypothetical protein [Nitrososphaerota archaeon]